MKRRMALKMIAGAMPGLGAIPGFGGPLLQVSSVPAQYSRELAVLGEYQCPRWFRDAKFGIWAHWGPQSVPMAGDWYARHIYEEGSEQAKYHREHYGHPSKVGHKDIVQQWKAENWDPDGLVAFYKDVGARYFFAQAVHHDNFDNWNSKHHRWNAKLVGPKRDVVGEWKQAAQKAGLRFALSEHLARSYNWFNVNKGTDKTGPMAGIPYDGNDPKYVDFYFPPHPGSSSDEATIAEVSPAWIEEYSNRIRDLIDSYEPDLLYTDGAIPFGDHGRRLVAHFYEQNKRRHGGRIDCVYTIKWHPEPCCTTVIERGASPEILPEPWQSETCIGDWFYKKGIQYKTSEQVVRTLVDVVSKNGNLNVSFPLRPDGTLDDEEKQIALGIRRWLRVNGEGIYETRPWRISGEGPTKPETGSFKESNTPYTSQDFRFTTRGATLYAFALAWPERGKVTIASLDEAGYKARIERVELLGAHAPLKFTRSAAGLEITFPTERVGEYAYGLKILS